MCPNKKVIYEQKKRSRMLGAVETVIEIRLNTSRMGEICTFPTAEFPRLLYPGSSWRWAHMNVCIINLTLSPSSSSSSLLTFSVFRHSSSRHNRGENFPPGSWTYKAWMNSAFLSNRRRRGWMMAMKKWAWESLPVGQQQQQHDAGEEEKKEIDGENS